MNISACAKPGPVWLAMNICTCICVISLKCVVDLRVNIFLDVIAYFAVLLDMIILSCNDLILRIFEIPILIGS